MRKYPDHVYSSPCYCEECVTERAYRRECAELTGTPVDEPQLRTLSDAIDYLDATHA